LSPSHPIDVVIEDKGGNLYVPSGSVNEMVPPNGYGIPVTHYRDYLKPGVGKLYPGSEGECPPMGSMQSIKVNIHRESAGTADAGDENDVILAISNLVNGSNQGADKNPDAAAWAPYVREPLGGAEVFMDEVASFFHGFISSSFCSNS